MDQWLKEENLEEDQQRRLKSYCDDAPALNIDNYVPNISEPQKEAHKVL